MRSIELELHEVDTKRLRNVVRPGSEHYDQVLRAPSVCRIGGESLLFALPAGSESVELEAALMKVEYRKSARSGGLWVNSRVFGFQPRVTTRRDFCTTASLAYDMPHEHGALCKWAENAADELGACMPAQREWQEHELLRKVHPSWQLPGGAFTSGIANKNNALAYHRDQGNFQTSWSVMYAFTRDIEGGLLVLPEYRIAFEFDEPTVIMFDGMRLLHGVTKINLRTKHSYRYTCVYYAMSGMQHCGTPQEELQRIRELKTRREMERVSVAKD